MSTATKIERANRVAVQAVGEGFEAKFHRTHKLVGTVQSKDTTWKPEVAGLNKTAQRELFRVWVCQNASLFGIEWDPTDRRSADNLMPSKYDSDALLMSTAGTLVRGDILGWVAKVAEASKVDGLELVSVEGEEIQPKVVHNGKACKAKYGNGNWSYATVDVVATVRLGEQEGYVRMACDLVSGQLKKPAKIGELGYTFTGFRTELAKDIPAVGDAPKVDAPAEQPTQPEQPAEGAQEQPQA